MGSLPSKISATRGAGVLGLSDYTSRFEVWQKIIEEEYPGYNESKGFIYPEFSGNVFTLWGNAFEDSIINLAEKKTDQKIINLEKFFIAKDYDFLTCHIDGQYNDKILHEAKTTFNQVYRQKWGAPGTDKIPQDYQVQCQHQLLCTNAEKVLLSVLVFPKSPSDWDETGLRPTEWNDLKYSIEVFKDDNWMFQESIFPDDWAAVLFEMGFFYQYEIYRNESLIKKMIEHYCQFWEKNIIGKIEPDDKNYEDLKRIIPNPCGSIIVDRFTEDLFLEIKDINKEMSPKGIMSKRKHQLKAMILENARSFEKNIDDDSTDKFIFYNTKGDRLGTYGKDKNGKIYFK